MLVQSSFSIERGEDLVVLSSPFRLEQEDIII